MSDKVSMNINNKNLRYEHYVSYSYMFCLITTKAYHYFMYIITYTCNQYRSPCESEPYLVKQGKVKYGMETLDDGSERIRGYKVMLQDI